MTSTNHSLRIGRQGKTLEVSLKANDAGHAQAQASDIARALKADNFSLTYRGVEESPLACLFRRLAYNEFVHTECESWNAKFCNGSPVVYALGEKYYVRPMILDYLEIHKEGCVKPSCGNPTCINPYHNSYKKMKASKLGDADTKLAVAFLGQGVPIKEIAKALKVHRSTIYRILHREHFHFGAAHHRRCRH